MCCSRKDYPVLADAHFRQSRWPDVGAVRRYSQCSHIHEGYREFLVVVQRRKDSKVGQYGEATPVPPVAGVDNLQRPARLASA